MSLPFGVRNQYGAGGGLKFIVYTQETHKWFLVDSAFQHLASQHQVQVQTRFDEWAKQAAIHSWSFSRVGKAKTVTERR